MEKKVEHKLKEAEKALGAHSKSFEGVSGIGVRGLLGGISGFCVGAFAKSLSRTVAVYAGFGICFLTWANVMGYISINWKKIDSEITHIVHSSDKGRTTFVKFMKRIVTHVIPLLGTFGTGIYYGFTHT